MKTKTEHLHDPVTLHIRKDFATLQENMTAQQALDAIRSKGVGEKVIYFYITDETDKLVGVLPTRRLLIIPPEKRLGDIMIKNVITIPHTATVMEACDYFSKHKYFAFPVIDERHHVVGVIDVGLFTDQVFDVSEREQLDDVFEAIGLRLSQIRDASPAKAFRIRFPWLLATICSGTVCALLSGMFEATLAQSLVMAFFITLVLGLGESVSIQSMTVAIQALHTTPPTWKWFFDALRREVATSMFLGGSCGGLVALIVWLWQGAIMAAIVIGGSVALSLFMACVIGLGIPSVLHALKLDPKIAAGPITLALTDISTLLIYFTLGTALLLKAA